MYGIFLKITDEDPNNSNQCFVVYTQSQDNEKIVEKEYNRGNGWNREHVWSKSHGLVLVR